MKYPDEVIATNKQGKKEVRLLLEKGKYVKYTHIDPETNKIVRVGKESIILKNNKGKKEHLFVIPIKDKFLLIKKPDDKMSEFSKRKNSEHAQKPKVFDKRKIWDKGKAVDLF